MSDLTALTLAEARDGLEGQDVLRRRTRRGPYGRRRRRARAELLHRRNAGSRDAGAAEAADARIAKGEMRPLEGIPLGIKDLYCTKGVQTTAGSHILEGFVPPYESTVSGNLWRDGATMLGKLNLDEFAMGSSNETSYFGAVTSPWRRRGSNAAIVPGGSSGGSAAAVAARLCFGATATDTGGSIRQPAAFTGTVGIKPTYGRCSRWGIVAFASSLDQAGPIARDVRDCAILLRSMAGHDPKDTTSVDLPGAGFRGGGRRLDEGQDHRHSQGISDGRPVGRDRRALAQGIDWLKDAGAEIVDISLPHTKYALAAYYIVAPAEASSNLARYDGVRYGLRVPGRDIIDMYEATRAAGFGKEVRRRIMIGTYVLSAGYYDAYYVRAQKIRTLIKRDFEEAFAQGCRCDPDAGDADGRLRRGREGIERPDRNVPQRRLHRDRQHGGPARHRGARRPVVRMACRSACSSSAVPSTRRRCSPPPRRSRRPRRKSSCRSAGGRGGNADDASVRRRPHRALPGATRRPGRPGPPRRCRARDAAPWPRPRRHQGHARRRRAFLRRRPAGRDRAQGAARQSLRPRREGRVASRLPARPCAAGGLDRALARRPSSPASRTTRAPSPVRCSAATRSPCPAR